MIHKGEAHELCPGNRAGGEHGYALVVVIWAIGLISLLFVTYIAAARYRSIEATSHAQRARAEGLAKAGINLAIVELLSRMASGKPQSGRFPFDGSAVLCSIHEDSMSAIAVSDEGGKVDLNNAAPDLIRALLRGIERDEKRAAQVATSILALRPDESRRDELVASGKMVSAIRSVLELDQIAGVDRALFRELMPLVSVHSRSAGVDPRVAPAALLRALNPDRDGAIGRAAATNAFPPGFAVDSSGLLFAISSEAMLRRGVRSGQEAIVEVIAEPQPRYRIREWRTAAHRLIGDGDIRIGLPEC